MGIRRAGLARQFEEKGLKGVGIKLIPRRFYDPALSRYCRHELTHIADMLDPRSITIRIPKSGKILAKKR